MTRKELELKLTAGKLYHVKIKDCCVAGGFTARFIGFSGDDEYIDISFDNGVKFTNCIGIGCTFEVVDELPATIEWTDDQGHRHELHTTGLTATSRMISFMDT